MADKVASAISFAAKMVRNGEYFGKAIAVAANYYGVPKSEVQRGMASRSGKSQLGKQKPRYKWTGDEVCQNCRKPAIYRGLAYGAYKKFAEVFSCADCGKTTPDWWDSGDNRAVGRIQWSVKPGCDD